MIKVEELCDRIAMAREGTKADVEASSQSIAAAGATNTR